MIKRILLTVLFLISNLPAIEIESTWIGPAQSSLQMITETVDNGCLVISTDSLTTITRYDQDMDTLWSHAWVLTQSDNKLLKILQDENGQYLLAGNFIEARHGVNRPGICSIILFEFDDNGDSLDFSMLQITQYSCLKDIIPLADGEHMLLAEEECYDEYWHTDGYSIRINSDLEVIDQNLIQRGRPSTSLSSITMTREADYLAIGNFRDQSNDRALLIKFSDDGEILWRSYLDNPPEFRSDIDCVKRLYNSDDNFVCFGKHDNSHSLWFCSVNTDGEELTNISLGEYETRNFFDMVKISDERFLIVSHAENEIDDTGDLSLILLVDKNGAVIECALWRQETISRIKYVKALENGGALIIGESRVQIDRHYEMHDVILRLSPLNSQDIDITDYKPVTTDFRISSIHPNPFNSSTRIDYTVPATGMISLSLFDQTGRLVNVLAQGTHSTGKYSLVLDGQGLASGVYMLRLSTGDGMKSRTITYLR